VVVSAKRAGGRRGRAGRSGAAAKGPGKGGGKVGGTVARAGRPARGGKAGARTGARSKAGAAGKPRKSRFPEVEELIGLMDRHDLLEVDYHAAPDGSRRIRLARTGSGHAPGAVPRTAGAGGHGAHAAEAAPAERAAGAALTAAAGGVAAPAPARDEGVHAFKSPMVGTFYRAPSPEAPPFVSVGDKVDTHGTVCIIEAMKVMNEITPDASGTVVSIEVENGEAVEFGQTLFLIRPN
jgi:acetyl-CoA carboxylase biotin carboxyl carrier protein